MTGGLEATGSQLAGGPVSEGGRWVAANLSWLRAVAVVLGAVVLLWGNDVSLSRLWWSLALVVVLLSLIQVMVGARRGAAGSDPAPNSDTMTREAV